MDRPKPICPLNFFEVGGITTHCKNHFDTNLVKSIKQLFRYVIFIICAIFSNGKWWPSWNAILQKIKMASYKKHSGTKLDQFQPMVLEIMSFSCLCYF